VPPLRSIGREPGIGWRHRDFTDGAFRLPPGTTRTGAVTFAVPGGVRIVAVRWTASSGFGSAAT
jgi:hypothetical protein